MARITIEDCLVVVPNMYDLVIAATKRARELYRGSEPLVKSKNRVIVTCLREIAARKVWVTGARETSTPSSMPH